MDADVHLRSTVPQREAATMTLSAMHEIAEEQRKGLKLTLEST